MARHRDRQSGQGFSPGANIGQFILRSGAVESNAVENAIKSLQDHLMAFRFARKPIVTAPRQRALGGGAEVAMAGARAVMAAETYIGLVEFGVGVIPAGGGCKELLRRVVSPHMTNDRVDALGYVQQVFETIAYAKVSESAFVARERGFIGPADAIVMNDDDVLGLAKATVIHLDETGYVPPDRGANSIYALGRRGIAAMADLCQGTHISDHDALMAHKLAHVLCGGTIRAAVGERASHPRPRARGVLLVAGRGQDSSAHQPHVEVWSRCGISMRGKAVHEYARRMRE